MVEWLKPNSNELMPSARLGIEDSKMVALNAEKLKQIP
jgi:hypothetical protein